MSITRTSASHLTKRFLFSCISLFSFLLSYVFYIHPIGHFQVALCPCVKPSLNMRNHSYMICPYRTYFHTKTCFETDTRIHSSMSCSQEPLIKLVVMRCVGTSFLRGIQYANVSLTHSLTHSGVDTVRN